MATSKRPSNRLTIRSLVTTRRYLSLAVSLVLVSVIILLVVIMPQIQASVELQGKITKERSYLAGLTQKEQSLQTVTNEEAFQKRTMVDAILPSHKPLLELLVGLNTAASQSRVIFTSFSLNPGEVSTAGAKPTTAKTSGKAPKRTTNRGNTGAMQVELKAEGSFSDVKNFLIAVEKTAPFSTITKISLNPRGDRGVRISDTDLVEAELSIETRYFTQSVSATLEAPLPTLGAPERQAMTDLAGFVVPQYEARQQVVGGGILNLFGDTQISDEVQELIRQAEQEIQEETTQQE